MNEVEAKGYRGVHHLLSRAKTAGWKITRTPSGHWRVAHPAGGGFTVAPRPTVRGLVDAEEQWPGSSGCTHPPPARGRPDRGQSDDWLCKAHGAAAGDREQSLLRRAGRARSRRCRCGGIVFTGSTPSAPRAVRNAEANLRRVERRQREIV